MRERLRAAYLGTETCSEDKDWHEGHLAQNSEHKRVPQHKQLVAEAELLIEPCR